jgi:hypothetical protein
MFNKIDLKIMKENRMMIDIKSILEVLNNHRKVDKEFKEKLENIGFKIEKGEYEDSYEYGEQEFIRIGKRLVWLVEEKCAYSDVVLARKYRIDVINEIEEALEEEKEIYEEEMKSICSFFNKYEN